MGAGVGLGVLLAGIVACRTAPERPPAPPPAPTTPTTPTAVVAARTVARLSHAEWDHTVRDLLGLDGPTGLADAFVDDPRSGPFDNDEGLGVDPVLWAQYLSAAAALADRVVADPRLRDRVTGGDPPETWIPRFAARVHRRPIPEEDLALYLRAHEEGLALADGPHEGTRHVLALLFQSPAFVYRLEGTGATPGVLDGHDVASRLSYALWNTLPDDTLLAEAASGALLDPAGRSRAVARMLADPRADEALIDFHRQLHRTNNYANVSPKPSSYPSFGPSTVEAMREEVDRFVGHVVTTDGGVRDLLLSRRTFVNADLARIYGVSGVPSDAWAHPVDLDPTRRAGLTTLAGFLAMNATDETDHPIERGAKLHHWWLCTDLPAPPPGATPVPRSGGGTTRERVEAHTGEGTCGEVCHARIINPLGYAYGHYGATGEWRDTDGGEPVDAAATYAFTTGERGFDGAVELSGLLAEEPAVHRCYAGYLFRYVYGHAPQGPADEAVVERAAAASFGEGASIRDLVGALVTDPRFLE